MYIWHNIYIYTRYHQINHINPYILFFCMYIQTTCHSTLNTLYLFDRASGLSPWGLRWAASGLPGEGEGPGGIRRGETGTRGLRGGGRHASWTLQDRENTGKFKTKIGNWEVSCLAGVLILQDIWRTYWSFIPRYRGFPVDLTNPMVGDGFRNAFDRCWLLLLRGHMSSFSKFPKRCSITSTHEKQKVH